MAKALRSPFPVCSSIRTYSFNQPGVGLNLRSVCFQDRPKRSLPSAFVNCGAFPSRKELKLGEHRRPFGPACAALD